MKKIVDGISLAEIDGQIINPPTPKPFQGDTEATWVYWTESDTEEYGVTADWIWERLRKRRDILLESSDFRMVTDAPWDLTSWIVYRKSLRDLPKSTKNPRLAEWPVAPNE